MEFLKKYKKAYIIIMVIICITTMIITVLYSIKPNFVASALGYVVTPVQKVVTNVCNFFNDKISFITNLSEIEDENTMLKEQVEELQAELSKLRQVEIYNEKLSELLELDQKYSNYSKVGAQVIGKDPGNWYDTFIIDKGTNSGFTKNMVVLANGALVGRILESGQTYSKVISLIDDMNSVPAKSARTDDIGFVKGDITLMLEGLCRMDYIDSAAEILEGDEIVTSNLSDVYPPGITIGYVKEIRTDANGLTKYAIISPTVDFKRLETVLVINETFEDKKAEVEE